MKDRLLSLVVSAGLGKALRLLKSRNGITVLCLHRVTEEEDFFWPPMKPNTFERLLRHCQKHYEVTDFAHISQNPSKPQLILSFDDGYYDFMEYALPLLLKYNLPCNHNVVINCLNQIEIIWTQRFNILCNHLRHQKLAGQLLLELADTKFSEQTTDWMGIYFATFHALLQMPKQERFQHLEAWEKTYAVPHGKVKMMNWNDVALAQQQGVSFGSHTVSHDALPTLSPKDLEKELLLSKELIESRTGKTCDVLSLPNGQSSSEVVEMAKQVGYKYVLFLDEHLYRRQPHNPQLVSRINMVEEAAAMMQLRMELFHRPKHILKG
ncbi:MAG: polysaccharide deacetylase family protein [Chitinophagaceae bacterium]